MVNKEKSLDQNLIEDFNLEANKLNKTKPLDFIYTGCQILEKKIFKKFNNDFLILSVLRNFKILGIFSRLAKRDNKNKYLKYIPYTWSLIKLRTKNEKVFDELRLILKNNKII